MIIICSCGMQIRSSDMNLENMVAKCRCCDSIIDLREQLSGSSSIAVPAVTRRQESLPLPSGWSVTHPQGELVLAWRWFTPQLIFIAFFCVAWDSFLVFLYTTAFTQGGPLIMYIFSIAHLAVGVALTYSTLAGFFNKTTVKITRRELSVSHGPIPWFNNKSIAVHELTALNIEPSANADSFNFQSTARWGQSTGMAKYQLNAITNNGKSIPLLTSLNSAEKAAFVKQTLQKELGLKS